MMIVGIGYKKHSGKDTLGKFLYEEILKHYVISFPCITHFADHLKEELAQACGVLTEEINGNKDLFRPALQWWGTEFRRKFGKNDNYWVDKMGTYLHGLDSRLVIIPDVRFPNEAEWIKRKGGKLIKITRPELNSIDTHASEIAMDNFSGWDMEVINDGSKEQLLHKAKGIINSLIIPSL
jgi:hypothetical protein